MSMILSPCWSCNGAGRRDCETCHGTGKFRTSRLDAWARRKLFLGTPRTKAEKKLVDSNGNEKWTRYSADVPPEFEPLLLEAARKLAGRNRIDIDRAAIVRMALFHLLEHELPEEEFISTDASDIVILPALEAGSQ